MPAPLRFNSDPGVKALYEMSDTDLSYYVALRIGTDFAQTTGVGALAVGSMTNGTAIGTWVDTYRSGSVGDHPVNAYSGILENSTTVYQNLSNGSLTGTPTRPLAWDSSLGGLREMTDNEIDDNIIAKIALTIVSSGNVPGAYRLQPTAPSLDGSWVSRGTLTNTLESGTTNTTTLWQKTSRAPTTIFRPVKFSSGVREMTDFEIQSLTFRLRNYIVNTGIGQYRLATSAPTSGGTWTEAGSGFDDTRRQVTDQSYAGTYQNTFTTSFTQNYSAQFTGAFTNTFAGSYQDNFTNEFTGIYQQNYAGQFTGNYTNTWTQAYSGAFSKLFTGAFSGQYTGQYSSLFTGVYTKEFTGTFTGNYQGNFTTQFAGSFQGNFSGIYAGPYTGTFSGAYSSLFTGMFSRAYTGSFLGTDRKSVV